MPTNSFISQILGLQITGMQYHTQFICFSLPTGQKIWLFDSSGMVLGKFLRYSSIFPICLWGQGWGEGLNITEQGCYEEYTK